MEESVLKHAAVAIARVKVMSLRFFSLFFFFKKKKKIHQSYSRENEAIPVEPLWILGIKLHHLLEQDMGYRGHSPTRLLVRLLLLPQRRAITTGENAHGSTRVSRLCVESSIGLEITVCVRESYQPS